MKQLVVLVACAVATSPFAAVDWSRPPVICPEAGVARGIPCPELSSLPLPSSPLPADADPRWKTDWAKDLSVCRARELLRREEAKPGSFTPVQVQISWMTVSGAENAGGKLQAMYSAAERFGMPTQILLGALTQESLLANLGISADGGNYSCGMAQLNITEWCQGMSLLSAEQRQALGWPAISCSDGTLASTMLAPYYEIAVGRLGQRPDYRLDAKDFAGIHLDQVRSQMPSGPAPLQAQRHQAITSFIAHCQDADLSILIKAYNLKSFFNSYVPQELRDAEVYRTGDGPDLSCERAYTSRYYPLHTGWLLTLAIYNAGPNMVRLLEHYYQGDAATWPELTPFSLVEALYWGGKYNATTKRVYFRGANQKDYSQTWFKSCVVQRHVARVTQHVTPPGVSVVSSLEPSACNAEAPASRQNSSGVRSH